MQQVYVVHYHEIALKGRNRPMFLKQLRENICAASGLGRGSVKIVSGRLIVIPDRDRGSRQSLDSRVRGNDIEGALSKGFGVSSFSPAVLARAEYGEIEEVMREVVRNPLQLPLNSDATVRSPTETSDLRGRENWTFAIRTTRGDKQFSMTSKELEVKLGDFVRKEFGKKVDLEKPDVTLHVEIFPGSRGQSFINKGLSSGGALVYTQRIPGPGGLPVGTQPRVAVLLSGGIDSPVAAYRIMKRGASLLAVHFHSYPFTTRASIDKVKELVGILSQYHGGRPIPLHIVPLAEAQKAVVKECSERYRVLLYRRLMLRIAEVIARKARAQALVSGESLGQVASQTLENLRVVEKVTSLPMLRPLIGYDKEEIIAEAKRIGTFDISIQPHDDCCSLFMPKNPATRARLPDIEREEAKLDVKRLVELCLRSTSLEHP